MGLDKDDEGRMSSGCMYARKENELVLEGEVMVGSAGEVGISTCILPTYKCILGTDRVIIWRAFPLSPQSNCS